jgi:hypothetical protein
MSLEDAIKALLRPLKAISLIQQKMAATLQSNQ